jgi:tetratricopeptide (TPR) repeat protein
MLALSLLAAAGCAASYDFRAHWLSRIEHLADNRKTGDAEFELDAYVRAFPGDARTFIVKARMKGLPEYEGVALAGIKVTLPIGCSAADAPLSSGMRLMRSNPWSLWYWGCEAENRGDLKYALYAYGLAYEYAPAERLIAERYANLLLKSGSYREALEIYLEILAELKSEASPYKRESGAVGYGLLLNGMSSEAAEALSGRLGEANLDNDFYFALALAYYKEKKYDQSVMVFENADNEGKLSPEVRDIYKSAMHRCLLNLRQLKLLQCGEQLSKKAEGLFPDEAVMHAHRAMFLMELGRKDEAAVEFKIALDDNPFNLDVVQTARLFFVSQGRPLDAFKAWERIMPASVAFGTDNLVKPLIDRIRSLAEKVQSDPDGKDAIELARAMRDFGWMREARAEYMRILEKDPQNRAAFAECREVAAHMKALAEVENYFDRHYDRMLDGKSVPGIGEVFEDVADIIRRAGKAEISAGDCWSAVFVGSEANPITRPDNPVVKYFRRYNQYVDIQQPYGRYPECKIMNIVAHRKRAAKYCGDELKYEEYVCDEDWVKAVAGYISGKPRVAGSTSYSSEGYYLDLAAIRPAKNYLRAFMGEKHKPDSRYEEFATALRSEEAVKNEPRFSFQLQDALYASARRSLGVGADAPGDNAFQALFEAEIADVAGHEMGHLKDFLGVVPFFAHLFGNFWIAAGCGFGPERITARFETVANAHAIAVSTAPALALASEMDWLEKFSEKPYEEVLLIFPAENVETSPYHRSAAAAFEAFVEYLEDHPAEIPGVEASKDLYMQIDKIPDSEMRRVARDYIGAPAE